MKAELNALLTGLHAAYEKSEIKDFCPNGGNPNQWFYSLVTTSLEPNGPLILGFNWGASGNYVYSPQTDIDKKNFELEDVGSLSRIYPYCRNHFGDDFLSKVSQSNYCFFRSKVEAQISENDIKLCEPIFEKLLSILKPSSILCFSSKLRKYLIMRNKIFNLESKELNYIRGSSKASYTAMKGTLDSGARISFLPHPNYPIKGEARKSAWDFCCGDD